MAGIPNEARDNSPATEFFDDLIDYSLQDLTGNAQVTEIGYTCKDGVGIEQEQVVLETPLASLVTERTRDAWKKITRRCVSQPSKRFSGITPRQVESGLIRIPINIPELHDRVTLPSEAVYASTTVDFDLELPDSRFFDPSPNKGRPGLRISFQDVTRKTREGLFAAMRGLTQENTRRYLNEKIAQSIRGTTNTPLREGVSRLESTPISIIEITERVTYADIQRKIPQPINCGGARITQGLSGDNQIEILKPGQGHKTWVRIPEVDEWKFTDRYVDPKGNVQDTIDSNLLALSRHLATGE